MNGEKFDWRMYLELARELAQDEREQSGRSAISRAYYAAFNHARTFLEQSASVKMPRDGTAHAMVPDQLRRMRPPRTRVANNLVQLKQLRSWADYRAGSKRNLAGEVHKALAYADQVIERLPLSP